MPGPIRRIIGRIRPIGPIRPGAIVRSHEDRATVDFTIDSDSIDGDIYDVESEVERIIDPKFDEYSIEENSIGDYEVAVVADDQSISDLQWLEDELDEAESRGVEIYNVRILI